jgi:hypothetical protein
MIICVTDFLVPRTREDLTGGESYRHSRASDRRGLAALRNWIVTAEQAGHIEWDAETCTWRCTPATTLLLMLGARLSA